MAIPANDDNIYAYLRHALALSVEAGSGASGDIFIAVNRQRMAIGLDMVQAPYHLEALPALPVDPDPPVVP